MKRRCCDTESKDFIIEQILSIEDFESVDERLMQVVNAGAAVSYWEFDMVAIPVKTYLYISFGVIVLECIADEIGCNPTWKETIRSIEHETSRKGE